MNSLSLTFRFTSIISYMGCFFSAVVVLINVLPLDNTLSNIKFISTVIYAWFCYFSFVTARILWKQKELNVKVFFRSLFVVCISLWLIATFMLVASDETNSPEVIFQDLSNDTINNIQPRTGMFVNGTLQRKCVDVCNRIEGAATYSVFYGNDYKYYVCNCYSEDLELLRMIEVN